jgi:hypothetical protein
VSPSDTADLVFHPVGLLKPHRCYPMTFPELNRGTKNTYRDFQSYLHEEAFTKQMILIIPDNFHRSFFTMVALLLINAAIVLD